MIINRIKTILVFFMTMTLVWNAVNAQAFLNTELVAQVRVPDRASEVWGYVGQDGIEYGLMGTFTGLRIYSLKDPSNPVQVGFIPGSGSNWREMKDYKDFVYLTTEASDGLLVVDMRYAPDSFPNHFIRQFTTEDKLESGEVNTCHNIYIDDKGYIYLMGCKPYHNGGIILDARNNQWSPYLVGKVDDKYVHDCFVKGDTLYNANIYEGIFSVWNIKDRKHPEYITEQHTGSRFTHNCWSNADGKYLFTTDERRAAYVESYDVSDLTDIKFLDRYQTIFRNGQVSVPHNVYHKHDKLYISYYTEGVKIVDARYPDNLIEVANYDTYDSTFTEFNGCWGVFAFLPSGLILASDRQMGFFVIKEIQVSPGFLHGKIVDKQTGNAITAARINISASQYEANEVSGIQGTFKTGSPSSNNVRIQIIKKGYYPIDTIIQLVPNQISDMVFAMTNLPTYSLQVRVEHFGMQREIVDAQVKVINSDFEFTGKTNTQGELIFNGIPLGNYEIIVGKWGYEQRLYSRLLDAQSSLTAQLSLNYEDDFILDLGWTASSTDPKVTWNRVTLNELNLFSSNFPTKDIANDLGNECMITSNYLNFDPALALNGTLMLRSPAMYVGNYNRPTVKYNIWAYGGNDSTSIKKTYLASANTVIPLEFIPERLDGKFNDVFIYEITDKDFIKDSIYFVVECVNDNSKEAIGLFAAFDVFRMYDAMPTRNVESDKFLVEIQPNPANKTVHIKTDQNLAQLVLYSIGGIKLCEFNQTDNFDVSSYQKGLYVLEIVFENKVRIRKKLVIL